MGPFLCADVINGSPPSSNVDDGDIIAASVPGRGEPSGLHTASEAEATIAIAVVAKAIVVGWSQPRE